MTTDAGGVPVLAGLAAYHTACAELPESARPTDDARGAVVVVDGAGEWWRAVRDAAAAGARAVVVHEPDDAPPAELAALADLGLAMVASRARLRADVVGDAVVAREGAAVRAVTIDGAAGAGEVAAFVRDAIGWGRVLAGGPLELRAVRSTERGVSALLEPARGTLARDEGTLAGKGSTLARKGSTLARDGGTLAGEEGTLAREEGTLARGEGTLAGDEGTLGGAACSLGIGVLADAAAVGVLRADALGEVRSHVTVDAAHGPASVVTATARGELASPPRYETAERLALRRAISALRGGEPPTDLTDLLHDATLAAALQEAPTEPLGGPRTPHRRR